MQGVDIEHRIPFAATLDWHGGETLYSWCARTHLGFGTSDRKSSVALFGHAEAFKEHEIPRGLPALASRTHGCIGLAEDILRHRTVLAAYLPFLQAEDEKKLLSRMASMTRRQPLALNGIHPAAAAALHRLRFCRACAAMTLDSQGFATWVLNAQLPGVWTCAIHECALERLEGRPGGWVLPDVKSSHCAIARSTTDVKTLQPLTGLAHALVGKSVDTQLLRRNLAMLANQNFPDVLRDPMTQDRMYRAWKESNLAKCLQRETALQPLVLQPRWMISMLRGAAVAHPFHGMLCWAFLTADWQPSIAIPWFLGAAPPANDRLQRELWPHGNESLPLPEQVEAALAVSNTKAELAQALDVGRRRLDRWLQETPAFNARWSQLRRKTRLEGARQRCIKWLTEHPTCNVSDFYAGCVRDIDWLSNHDRPALNELLRRIPNRRSAQKFLPGFRPTDVHRHRGPSS